MQIEWFEYLQIACFLTAVVCYKGLQWQGIALFIPLLLLDCITDLLGDNYKAFGWKDNYFLYNFYLLLSAPLSFYLFYKMLSLRRKLTTVFLAAVVLCMLLVVFNYFFVQGRYAFNSYSLLLVMILNIVFSCLVLVKIALDDAKWQNFFNEPFFWINAATLLFSLGTLVILGLQQYIALNNIKLEDEVLYDVVMPVLNVFLYTALSYGFILCQLQQKKLP